MYAGVPITRLGVARKTYLQHDFCYGDDHTSLQEAGIPSIAPMDCVEAHNVAGTRRTITRRAIASGRCTCRRPPRSPA